MVRKVIAYDPDPRFVSGWLPCELCGQPIHQQHANRVKTTSTGLAEWQSAHIECVARFAKDLPQEHYQ